MFSKVLFLIVCNMVVLKEVVNLKYFIENLIVKPSNPINLKYQKQVMGEQNISPPKLYFLLSLKAG